MLALREKCPNMELFLVRIFPHLDRRRGDTKYLSVFSPNVGKYGPEITPYFDIFRNVVYLFKPFIHIFLTDVKYKQSANRKIT